MDVLVQVLQSSLIRLVGDELRHAWKADERRQQQRAVTKTSGQVGHFPAASVLYRKSQKHPHPV